MTLLDRVHAREIRLSVSENDPVNRLIELQLNRNGHFASRAPEPRTARMIDDREKTRGGEIVSVRFSDAFSRPGINEIHCTRESHVRE